MSSKKNLLKRITQKLIQTNLVLKVFCQKRISKKVLTRQKQKIRISTKRKEGVKKFDTN
jgi:hypothetical protein